ncbi:hypothetical protein GKODMF_02370 [Candidatus Electrothrix gigas]
MYIDEVEKLKNTISSQLQTSALSYYKIGMDAFHQSKDDWPTFQPAIGTLSISVELTLKAIICKKSIGMLYSNLTEEAKMLLCYPEIFTGEHILQRCLVDIKSSRYKSIEFNKAIALCYIIFPSLKQNYKAFLKFLSEIRNNSVHLTVPNFQRYQLERIAYYTTKLFITIDTLSLFDSYNLFHTSEKTKIFLDSYKESKIKKVERSIASAKEKIKKGDISEQGCDEAVFSGNWQVMCGECPVCGLTATFFGDTDEILYKNFLPPELIFSCESFECGVCGLTLDDIEEIKLAGLETEFNRSDEVEEWVGEYPYYN